MTKVNQAEHLQLNQAIVGLAMSKKDERTTKTNAVAKCETGVTVNRYGVGKPTTISGINAMAHLAHSMGVSTPALEKSINDSSRGISKSASNQCYEIAQGIAFKAGILYKNEDGMMKVKGDSLATAATPLTAHWEAMAAEWAVVADTPTTNDDDGPTFDDDDGPTFESIAAGSEEATVTTNTDSKAVTVFETLDDFKAFCETDTDAVVEKAHAMLATLTSGKDPRFARVHHSKTKDTFEDPEDRAAVMAKFSTEQAFYDTLCEAAGYDALRLKAYVRNGSQRTASTGRKYDTPAHQLLTVKKNHKGPKPTVAGVKKLVRILGAACLVNGGRKFYAARTAANVPESFVEDFLGAFGMDPSVAVVGAKNDRTWRWAYDATGWSPTTGTNTPSVADLANMFL